MLFIKIFKNVLSVELKSTTINILKTEIFVSHVVISMRKADGI